jgi:hypothetical protein
LLTVWDLRTGETLERIAAPPGSTDVSISSDGLKAALVSEAPGIRIYRVKAEIQRNHATKSRLVSYPRGSARFSARSPHATASCCTKNTAKDFANKMQNPGHLSLGQGSGLLV